MELLNLIVPSDMCVLRFLAKLRGRTENAWTFLHETVVNTLLMREGIKASEEDNNCWIISLEEKDKSTSTIVIRSFDAQAWYTVVSIDSKYIEFRGIDYMEDPQYIICLKMML